MPPRIPACWLVSRGAGSSRRLFEHNLAALVNVLEYCREHRAGLLLLSSSRVYSIAALAAIPFASRAKPSLWT